MLIGQHLFDYVYHFLSQERTETFHIVWCNLQHLLLSLFVTFAKSYLNIITFINIVVMSVHNRFLNHCFWFTRLSVAMKSPR